MSDPTTDDVGDNGGPHDPAHDPAGRMEGLSEERRRLLAAMMREHGMGGGGERAGGAAEAEGAGRGGDRSPPPFDDDGAPPDPASSLVAIKAGGSRPPFFCVHAILGSAFPYHRLAMHMDPEQPFYGLQSPGLDGVTKPLESIEEMAGAYIERIRGVQPRGPYHLGGYSFGGWVAFEMAQQLRGAGESVALLAILGAGAPIAMSNPALFEQLKYAAEYADDYRDLVLNSFWSDAVRTTAPESPPHPNPWRSPVATVAAANHQAQFRYIPRPYAGVITLFATSEQHAATHPDPTMGWRMLSVEEVVVHRVGGNHLNMLREPHVKGLAELLRDSLRTAPSAGL